MDGYVSKPQNHRVIGCISREDKKHGTNVPLASIKLRVEREFIATYPGHLFTFLNKETEAENGIGAFLGPDF